MKEKIKIEDIDLETLRHSAAHLTAQAVKELYPETQLTIGPPIEDGYFYDFYREKPFIPEDLEKIEDKMKEIAKRDHEIVRKDLTKQEAYDFFRDRGETYKKEILDNINENIVSIYSQGDFTDLCEGPHVPSTGYLKSIKLLHTSAAYWRGDEKNTGLQRIYGTCWRNKKELKDYLNRLEEAKKRDHRKLGKELDLYTISEDVGPGLILWHPKGAKVRYIIEEFWKKQHYENGYELVASPHTAKIDLWETSGHTDFYKENMFSGMDVDGQEYVLKPMNCPFHVQIFKTRLRSYRDLPLRWAELGTVYRYERTGVLHGLLRVRGFTQDDAHLFCRPDQLEDEIIKVVDFILFILRSFGFNEFKVFLSTRPEKSVGSDEDWKQANDALKNALEKIDLHYEEDPGEGVFYGPKIDIKIKDSLNRFWQVSTVQVDFNLPQRFDINFIGEDGKKSRPIMIHRALMGSIERFFGCLIEHFTGAFPVWLAPTQVIILPITDHQVEYVEKITKRLSQENIRFEKDLRNEKIGFKIREAQLAKIPYAIILGENEVRTKKVSVRKRKSKETRIMDLEDFISELKEVETRKTLD